LIQPHDYYPTTGGPATTLPVPPDIAPEHTLNAHEWGMLSFLFSEVAFFSTLIVAYVTLHNDNLSGPTSEVLSLPLAIATTSLLLASSFTVHLATHALGHGRVSLFNLWWAVTIALGIGFLAGTAYEWHGLIVHDGLTISRNLFGSTFYTLVGFHALHVSGGVLVMVIVLGLSLSKAIGSADSMGARMVSWYWHFVDIVWIVVFAVVYLA
jgi:cytochrome c oxidase subunit 3/cytochrome o ubiquinol oxidase subunit 3